MICRATLLLAALAGCSALAAPMVKVTAKATQPVELETLPSLPDGTTSSWRLADRPPASAAVAPADGAKTMFVPDVRGAYLVELWIDDGLSKELAERIEVDVAGLPPMPLITLGAPVTAGSAQTADATQSYSPEELPLTFAWRLTMRPPNSVAALSSSADPMISFVADVPGTYGVELTAFDGGLRSLVPATATVVVDP